ncbi:MAG TPA: right-handed parallel beta-helix repeat-containing protein, partial [Baekduia sp.]|nr:right-handed parallel beta-helix repeat-containing protein [Baekduia sp.]
MAGGALALALAIPAMASGATVGAQYTYSPTAPVTGQAVTFNAAGSTCGAVTPCSFTWEDDGTDGAGGTQYPLGSGQTLSFTFKVVGTKNVRLKVYDKNGVLQAQALKAVKVAAPPTTPPPTTPPPTTPPPTTPPPTTPPPTTPATCSRNATTSTFAAQVSAATTGQVICLAAGNYGTWTGTNKAIFVRAASGATVTMGFNFTTGDSGFTVDGVTTPGGNITNGAKSITIKNSKFTGHMVLDGLANSNVVLDHNTHDGITTCSSCDPAMVHLAYGSSTPSGVTISNSLFANGNADGIQTGVGVNIINNEFRNIHENGPNDTAHTDAIQLLGAAGSVVRGNYIHNTADGIVAYDGIQSALIENNVIDLVNGRWGIELYSDNGSTIRHNTLVYGT